MCGETDQQTSTGTGSKRHEGARARARAAPGRGSSRWRAETQPDSRTANTPANTPTGRTLSTSARFYLLPPSSPNIPSSEDCPKETASRFRRPLLSVEPREIGSLLMQLRSSPVAIMCHRRRGRGGCAGKNLGKRPAQPTSGGGGHARGASAAAACVSLGCPSRSPCPTACIFRPPSSALRHAHSGTLHTARRTLQTICCTEARRRLRGHTAVCRGGGHVVPMAVCRCERGEREHGEEDRTV